MFKLNNRGWGLTTFLAFISVFFLAILLVSYIASKNGLGNSGYICENIILNN